MFYHGSIDGKLRFGDVVRGYPSVVSKIEKPLNNDSHEPYSIDVQIPRFSVILDPCCEIGKGMISLTPLEEVTSSFWDIEYLAKDMTLINLEGMASDLMHPEAWNKLSNDKKIKALIAINAYGYTPYFVYEGNPLFPEYSIKRENKYNELLDDASRLPRYERVKQPTTIGTRHRMINFKNVYRVNCQKIMGSEKPTDEDIQKSVVLQLSIRTRNQLRDKMAYYFGNKPKEDTIET